MRPTPFSLVLEPVAPQRFPQIQRDLSGRGLDPRDRDAFLMIPEAVALIRSMRPAEGIGDGMDQLVAFVHHGYLQWAAGGPLLQLDRAQLDALLQRAPATGDGLSADDTPDAWYAQLPERLVWAQVLEEAAHEPLDGLFVHRAPDGRLRVLGVFGIRADRDGFSAVETEGPRPAVSARAGGGARFSPNLPGAEAAGLYSLADADELLDLGWRTAALWGTDSLRGPQS